MNRSLSKRETNRQEAIHAREGIDLSRQTMSGWVMQLDERQRPGTACAFKRSLCKRLSGNLHPAWFSWDGWKSTYYGC
jgi:hypothetical protein